ncbi:hypothetical protein SAMN02745126_05046 [Enhydrobacter aerosaccus]|uniref:Uncharacterized protein n=1 Tax=Enhydrobacter aerosaccus TaxID=225324 RepID=A0A1T4SRW9_9HYPH|nr:hypothetical protein [Enhydrobacter aerosaccus]SKA30896.1 hypothetical protein SAMN02745126_05046 [Enhydrobacter aerosaccus]
MARIRTIKPEFFTSDDICALSPLARLLYVGLWCEADRAGRLVWMPRVFKRRYLPDDACDIETLSAELLGRGLVVLYGDGLAHIPTFSRHQHVNPREASSKLPSPDDDASSPASDASERAGDASERASDAQGGREGNREGREGELEGEGARDGGRAQALPDGWKPDEEDLAWAATARPDLDAAALAAETERFRNHALANGRTAHRWGPNWRNWIGRANATRETAGRGLAGTLVGTRGRGEIGAGTVDRESDGQWRARLRGYRPGRFWLDGDWGPRPESGQSRVSAALLAEWRTTQSGEGQRGGGDLLPGRAA